jgi:voltage-gated potassium channel Kch
MAHSSTQHRHARQHPGTVHRYGKRLKDWFESYQYAILLGLWIGALVLGYIGYSSYFQQARSNVPGDEATNFLDWIYFSIILANFEWGAAKSATNAWLNLARFLLPVLTAYTALKVFYLFFRREYLRAQLLLMRGHTVICGLSRKGLLLAESLREKGERVVVIEANPEHPDLDRCTQKGVITLIGDATEPDLLAKAKIQRAKTLVAVCSEDDKNIEIAASAEILLEQKGRKRRLNTLVHISDASLQRSFGKTFLEDGQAFPNLRLDQFNVYDHAARLWLQKTPAAPLTQVGRPVHLVVVGLNHLGRSLVVHAARAWYESGAVGRQPMPLSVTVVDAAAPEQIALLKLDHPQIQNVCQLHACTTDTQSPGFRQGDFLLDPVSACQASAVYICLAEPSLGLNAATVILALGQNIPVHVRIARDSSMASLLEGNRLPARPFAFDHLHLFWPLKQTCTPDLLLQGERERLAMLVHEDYLLRQGKAGATAAQHPILLAWQDLPEEMRESNRQFIDHLQAKLHEVSCRLSPLTDWDACPFEFSQKEVSRLAVLEHQRWYAEREKMGWTFQPGPSDLVRKTSPALLAWEDLPPAEQLKTKEFVRDLPRMLARIDLQIVRIRDWGKI